MTNGIDFDPSPAEDHPPINWGIHVIRCKYNSNEIIEFQPIGVLNTKIKFNSVLTGKLESDGILEAKYWYNSVIYKNVTAGLNQSEAFDSLIRYDLTNSSEKPVYIGLPLPQLDQDTYVPSHTHFISTYNGTKYAYCCAVNPSTSVDALVIYDISSDNNSSDNNSSYDISFNPIFSQDYPGTIKVLIDFTDLYNTTLYSETFGDTDADKYHINGITVFENNSSRYCAITLKEAGDCLVIKDPLPEMLNRNDNNIVYENIQVYNVFGNTYGTTTKNNINSIHNVWYSSESQSLTIFHNNDPQQSQIIQYPLNLITDGSGQYGIPASGSEVANAWDIQGQGAVIVDLDFYTAHQGAAKPLIDYKIWIVACGESYETYSGVNKTGKGPMIMTVKWDGTYKAYNAKPPGMPSAAGEAIYDCFTYFENLDNIDITYT